MAKKKVVLTEEERKRQQLEVSFNHAQDAAKFLPECPFDIRIGDSVEIGNLQDCVVRDIIDNKLYLIEYTNVEHNYGNPIITPNIFTWRTWDRMRPVSSILNTQLATRVNRINYSNSQISEFFGKVYHFGVDFNPYYQRGYVWELEDKISLIESVYRNIEIGRFLFVAKPWISANRPLYEILDGKQRLNAIIEFTQNKFPIFEEYYWENLSKSDTHHLESYQVGIATLPETTTEKEKLEIFLKVNTSGKVMAKEHLQKVESLLNELGE